MFLEHKTPKSLREILLQNCEPSEELVTALESVAEFRHVKKGEFIVKQGEKSRYFIFIRMGLFRVTHTSVDNTEDTILFGTSGDVYISMHSYYAEEPAVFSLCAVEDSEIWLVSYENMRNLLDNHLDLLRWMHDLMIEQFYAFEKRYLFFSNKSAEERFVNFLRDRYGSLKRAPLKSILSLVPLKFIAQYLKITQSTLSRLRKKLVRGEYDI